MSPSIRYRDPARLSWASRKWEIHHCEVYVRRLGHAQLAEQAPRKASCRAKFPPTSTSSAGSGKQCLHPMPIQRQSRASAFAHWAVCSGRGFDHD